MKDLINKNNDVHTFASNGSCYGQFVKDGKLYEQICIPADGRSTSSQTQIIIREIKP